MMGSYASIASSAGHLRAAHRSALALPMLPCWYLPPPIFFLATAGAMSANLYGFPLAW
jgi:hypothetical protein